jgi:hypothetical protein
MNMWDLDDLINGVEVARICGVSPSAVCNWRKRLGHPVPVWEPPSGGPFYSRLAVEQWVKHRAKGRGHRAEPTEAELLAQRTLINAKLSKIRKKR